MVHETVLFYGVTYGTKIITITPSDYTKCPDFAVIYDMCRTATDDSNRILIEVTNLITSDVGRGNSIRRPLTRAIR